MNTLLDNLIATRALIEHPDDWERGTLVSPSGCMCLLGAIGIATGLFTREEVIDAHVIHAYYNLDQSPTAEALAQLIKAQAECVSDYPYTRATTIVSAFNDDSVHSDVIALLDKAISNLQGINDGSVT